MSITRFAVLLGAFVVTGLYILVTWFLVGLCNDQYISSFIEVAIAADLALQSTRFRRWLTRNLKQFGDRRITGCVQLLGKNLSERMIQMLCAQEHMVLRRFRIRIHKLDKVALSGSLLFAGAGIVILLTGVDLDSWWKNLVAILMLPVVLYYIASLICYICMCDHFSEVCGNVERTVPEMDDQELARTVEDMTKKLNEFGVGK